ncbi:MAG: serine/threonine protein kinase [Labilithrix sp.]|nr:serine/threonine protein kinase [Labilithrix sp.]
MECLDEETILAFGGGELEAGKRKAAQEHINTCDECRALVSAVARASRPDAGEVAADPAMAATTPARGAQLSSSAGGRAAGSAGPAIAPVQPGDVLAGKFEIERVLGAGGMGIVVAARHRQLDQRVALKFLLPVACEVPGAVARFLREGKAAARITSEHVARVMDTGMLDGGAPYLVMEHLEGSDLGALVQERGALPAVEAIEYVLQACEAIVEAHDLGIVHRDLKPANLFLTHRADGSPLVKVLDFGISKIEGGSRSQLTSASMLMGSPRYMSPEQMLSAKDVDVRTDVWALGVVLYELVAGKPVWQADTVQGLCALIASAPAPALRASAPDAPALLEEVVARCLTKSRDDRIASVADFARALEPIAPDSAKTSIERVLRVGGRLAKSHPAPARAVASRGADATTDRSADRAPPSRAGLLLALGVGALLVAGVAVNALRAPAGAPPAPVAVQPASPSASPSPPTPEPSAIAPSASPSDVASAASAATAPSASIATRRLPRASAAPSAPAAPPSSANVEAQPSATASSRALTDRK